MSIRDASEKEAKARARQLKQRDEQHQADAAIRPDPIHRTLRFLIGAAVVNNPDLKEEAGHYLETLDKEIADIAPQLEGTDEDEADTNDDDSAEEKAPEPTAAMLKTSARFRRARSGR